MEFEKMLERFSFLFEDNNDIKRDVLLAKKNVDIHEKKRNMQK